MPKPKEIPLQKQTDKLLSEKKLSRPVDSSIGREIIVLLATEIESLHLDIEASRKIKAIIFNYLTAGSGQNTHLSGEREGAEVGRTKKVDRVHRRRSLF